MHLPKLCLTFVLLWCSVAAQARDEVAGAFDYYVLSLSWSPNWCALEGDARESSQCMPDRNLGWTLHGLWPQFDRGYPSYCRTLERPPSRSVTAGMADIMGTDGLAWHQWKKHGACTGLAAFEYYDISRQAYAKVIRPEVFRKLDRRVKLPASVVEDAFLKANPALTRDGITVTCRARHIQEVRICLSRDLDFVPCGQDVVRDCTLQDALFTPID